MVQYLGWEDPPEKEMATHSSVLAWRIPRTEEPGGLYSPQGRKESDRTERLHFHFEHSLYCLSLGLEWKLIFSSPVATAGFSKFAGILSTALQQQYLLGFEITQRAFHHLH